MKKTIIPIIALTGSLSLGGCAATQTMISHRSLEVENKMSASVFLEPVADTEKTILVQVRNTSDKAEFNPKNEINNRLTEAGYKIVTDPSKAHYMLQANILKVGKLKPEEASGILSAGFGGTLQGLAAGAALGSYSSHNNSVLTGGLIGGAVSMVADSLVKDVTYTVVTDIRISERILEGQSVTDVTMASLRQGTSGSKNTISKTKTNWQRQETRVVSSANKVNLDFNQAKPELLAGLARSISGIFA